MKFVYDPPISPYLNILYRDDHIVVCDKPSGLLSVRGKAPEHQDSLEKRLQTIWPTMGVVHRLDMATSGIMVIVLNKPAHKSIARQFQERQTDKTYIARVYGRPQVEQGVVELPLICDWPNRPKQMVEHIKGKKAQTYWQLIESDGQTSRIKLKPISGRSHQLRVHMLSIGHVILGDRLYATGEALALAPRLQLHAHELKFKHPVSHDEMRFVSPTPF